MIGDLVERGVLERFEISSTVEQRELVRFALHLDDGEAHSCRSIGDAELARIVSAIARRASFFPPKEDPHFDRWMKLLQPKT